VTSRGGGSSGIRSTWGTCSRFSLIYRDQQDLKRDISILTSCDRAADFANRPGFAKPKAFGLRSAEVSEGKGTGGGLVYLQYASSSSSSPSRADAAYSIDPPSCVDCGYDYSFILNMEYLLQIFSAGTFSVEKESNPILAATTSAN
jgi:hypothetical protein